MKYNEMDLIDFSERTISAGPKFIIGWLQDLYGPTEGNYKGLTLHGAGLSSSILYFVFLQNLLEYYDDNTIYEFIDKSIRSLCDTWNEFDFDHFNDLRFGELKDHILKAVSPEMIKQDRQLIFDLLQAPYESGMSKYNYVTYWHSIYWQCFSRIITISEPCENDLKNIFSNIDKIFLREYFGNSVNNIQIDQRIEYSLSYCMYYTFNYSFCNRFEITD